MYGQKISCHLKLLHDSLWKLTLYSNFVVTTFASRCKIDLLPVTVNVILIAVIVDQAIDAMGCLSLGIIYILMQVRYKADICHAVGTDSAYCFGLCYFGIDVREKSYGNFKLHCENFCVGNWFDRLFNTSK